MRMLGLCAVLLSCLPLAGFQDAAAEDLKKLQGSWELAALEVNGQDVPLEKLKGTTLTVKDFLYTVKIKDQVLENRIELDPSKSPKNLDLIPLEGANKDKIHKGIYKIDGDTFMMARGLAPEQDRPEQFATWPNTNYFVVTWKRLPK